ncbi:hypothetical protein KIN20_008648 [Parelaphostrongylus tenuis]|uniref:Uncharacterized protein n=1 Tax=Parelaphostrongylus tenuis TaxID=148309 RepID=A0AAD5MWW8_PARTN|nr:hypothetical protein KIN20_008648 [Parelaphostrongylus tenuis]
MAPYKDYTKNVIAWANSSKYGEANWHGKVKSSSEGHRGIRRLNVCQSATRPQACVLRPANHDQLSDLVLNITYGIMLPFHSDLHRALRLALQDTVTVKMYEISKLRNGSIINIIEGCWSENNNEMRSSVTIGFE